MELTNYYNVLKENCDERTLYINNIGLWKKFYKDRSLLLKKNLGDERLYEIIKFLLKYERTEICEYFPSDILNALFNEEMMLPFKMRMPQSKNLNSIEHLMNNLECHNELSSYLNTVDLSHDYFAQTLIKSYQSLSLELDTVEAIIMILHQNFFNISPDVVEKIVNYIEKEVMLFTKEDTNYTSLHINLIYQYLDKFIPIKKYIGIPLSKDSIINKILNGEIKDKSVVHRLLKTLNKDELLELLNDDFENFVTFVNKLTFFDEANKYSIIYQMIEKLLNEEYYDLIFNWYLKYKDSDFIDKYIDNKKLTKLVEYATNDSPAYLDFQIIEYLLEEGHITLNFIYNLNELTSSSQNIHTKEEVEKIKEKIKDYPIPQNIQSFKESIKQVNDYLENKINLNEEQTKQIMKIITKTLNTCMELDNLDVYFVESDRYNGEFFYDDDNVIINLNNNLIKNFLNKDLSLNTRIRIFITILHELRHHQEYKQKNKFNIEEYEMMKEKYLIHYDQSYYDNNYHVVLEEIDARIESYNMITKFFEAFLPNQLNNVQDSIIKSLKQELDLKNKKKQEKKISILNQSNIDFEQAFDTLIKYNKKILEKEPILLIEYHFDGTPKSIDELLSTKDEENNKFIDELLKRRYKHNLSPKLNPFHTK